MFRLPLMSHPLADWLIPDFFYSFDQKERRYGYHMRATRGVRYEETLKLPEGWTVEQIPEAQELDSAAASLKFQATSGDGQLRYTNEMVLKKHNVPAEDYAGLKEAIDTMMELTNEWVVCSVAEDKMAGSEQAAMNMAGDEVTHD